MESLDYKDWILGSVLWTPPDALAHVNRIARAMDESASVVLVKGKVGFDILEQLAETRSETRKYRAVFFISCSLWWKGEPADDRVITAELHVKGLLPGGMAVVRNSIGRGRDGFFLFFDILVSRFRLS